MTIRRSRSRAQSGRTNFTADNNLLLGGGINGAGGAEVSLSNNVGPTAGKGIVALSIAAAVGTIAGARNTVVQGVFDCRRQLSSAERVAGDTDGLINSRSISIASLAH
jgi:hypothetical protein